MKSTLSKSTASKVHDTEVVTDAQVNAAELASLATSIDQSIDLVTKFEDSFEESTLEHRLAIGMHVARAQEIFTLTHSAAGALKGKGKESLSTVDRLPESDPAPTGFVSWLGKNVKRLKRPTAYRYASAFRALELPLESKPADIKEKLKKLRHDAGKAKLPMPTLAALVKAAPKIEKPETLAVVVPKSSKQLRLEDAREAYHNWMDAWDKALKSGHLDHLDKKGLDQLNEFTATVRDRIKARLR